MTQQIWFVSTVLVALARHMLANRVSPTFTVADLLKWCPSLEKASTARLACRMLWTAGLAKKAPPVNTYDNRNPRDPARWQLTDAGIEAARTAQAAAASEARSKSMRQVNTTPRTNTLAGKLWTLLRVRRAITSQEAAATLCDAGADATAMRKQINHYLAAWAFLAPDTVQVGERRVNGHLRYVLVSDKVGQHLPHELIGAQAKVEKLKRQQRRANAS